MNFEDKDSNSDLISVTSLVTMAKFLNPARPQFLHLWRTDDKNLSWKDAIGGEAPIPWIVYVPSTADDAKQESHKCSFFAFSSSFPNNM